MPTLDLRTLNEYLCTDCGGMWLAARAMPCPYCGGFDIELDEIDYEELNS